LKAGAIDRRPALSTISLSLLQLLQSPLQQPAAVTYNHMASLYFYRFCIGALVHGAMHQYHILIGFAILIELIDLKNKYDKIRPGVQHARWLIFGKTCVFFASAINKKALAKQFCFSIMWLLRRHTHPCNMCIIAVRGVFLSKDFIAEVQYFYNFKH
jgi:hypothetical protein